MADPNGKPKGVLDSFEDYLDLLESDSKKKQQPPPQPTGKFVDPVSGINYGEGIQTWGPLNKVPLPFGLLSPSTGATARTVDLQAWYDQAQSFGLEGRKFIAGLVDAAGPIGDKTYEERQRLRQRKREMGERQFPPQPIDPNSGMPLDSPQPFTDLGHGQAITPASKGLSGIDKHSSEAVHQGSKKVELKVENMWNEAIEEHGSFENIPKAQKLSIRAWERKWRGEAYEKSSPWWMEVMIDTPNPFWWPADIAAGPIVGKTLGGAGRLAKWAGVENLRGITEGAAFLARTKAGEKTAAGLKKTIEQADWYTQWKKQHGISGDFFRRWVPADDAMVRNKDGTWSHRPGKGTKDIIDPELKPGPTQDRMIPRKTPETLKEEGIETGILPYEEKAIDVSPSIIDIEDLGDDIIEGQWREVVVYAPEPPGPNWRTLDALPYVAPQAGGPLVPTEARPPFKRATEPSDVLPYVNIASPLVRRETLALPEKIAVNPKSKKAIESGTVAVVQLKSPVTGISEQGTQTFKRDPESLTGRDMGDWEYYWELNHLMNGNGDDLFIIPFEQVWGFTKEYPDVPADLIEAMEHFPYPMVFRTLTELDLKAIKAKRDMIKRFTPAQEDWISRTINKKTGLPEFINKADYEASMRTLQQDDRTAYLNLTKSFDMAGKSQVKPVINTIKRRLDSSRKGKSPEEIARIDTSHIRWAKGPMIKYRQQYLKEFHGYTDEDMHQRGQWMSVPSLAPHLAVKRINEFKKGLNPGMRARFEKLSIHNLTSDRWHAFRENWLKNPKGRLWDDIYDMGDPKTLNDYYVENEYPVLMAGLEANPELNMMEAWHIARVTWMTQLLRALDLRHDLYAVAKALNTGEVEIGTFSLKDMMDDSLKNMWKHPAQIRSERFDDAFNTWLDMASEMTDTSFHMSKEQVVAIKAIRNFLYTYGDESLDIMDPNIRNILNVPEDIPTEILQEAFSTFRRASRPAVGENPLSPDYEGMLPDPARQLFIEQGSPFAGFNLGQGGFGWDVDLERIFGQKMLTDMTSISSEIQQRMGKIRPYKNPYEDKNYTSIDSIETNAELYEFITKLTGHRSYNRLGNETIEMLRGEQDKFGKKGMEIGEQTDVQGTTNYSRWQYRTTPLDFLSELGFDSVTFKSGGRFGVKPHRLYITFPTPRGKSPRAAMMGPRVEPTEEELMEAFQRSMLGPQESFQKRFNLTDEEYMNLQVPEEFDVVDTPRRVERGIEVWDPTEIRRMRAAQLKREEDEGVTALKVPQRGDPSYTSPVYGNDTLYKHISRKLFKNEIKGVDLAKVYQEGSPQYVELQKMGLLPTKRDQPIPLKSQADIYTGRLERDEPYENPPVRQVVTGIVPLYVGTTEKWVNNPWSIMDLTREMTMDPSRIGDFIAGLGLNASTHIGTTFERAVPWGTAVRYEGQPDFEKAGKIVGLRMILGDTPEEALLNLFDHDGAIHDMAGKQTRKGPLLGNLTPQGQKWLDRFILDYERSTEFRDAVDYFLDNIYPPTHPNESGFISSIQYKNDVYDHGSAMTYYMWADEIPSGLRPIESQTRGAGDIPYLTRPGRPSGIRWGPEGADAANNMGIEIERLTRNLLNDLMAGTSNIPHFRGKELSPDEAIRAVQYRTVGGRPIESRVHGLQSEEGTFIPRVRVVFRPKMIADRHAAGDTSPGFKEGEVVLVDNSNALLELDDPKFHFLAESDHGNFDVFYDGSTGRWMEGTTDLKTGDEIIGQTNAMQARYGIHWDHILGEDAQNLYFPPDMENDYGPPLKFLNMEHFRNGWLTLGHNHRKGGDFFDSTTQIVSQGEGAQPELGPGMGYMDNRGDNIRALWYSELMPVHRPDWYIQLPGYTGRNLKDALDDIGARFASQGFLLDLVPPGRDSSELREIIESFYIDEIKEFSNYATQRDSAIARFLNSVVHENFSTSFLMSAGFKAAKTKRIPGEIAGMSLGNLPEEQVRRLHETTDILRGMTPRPYGEKYDPEALIDEYTIFGDQFDVEENFLPTQSYGRTPFYRAGVNPGGKPIKAFPQPGRGLESSGIISHDIPSPYARPEEIRGMLTPHGTGIGRRAGIEEGVQVPPELQPKMRQWERFDFPSGQLAAEGYTQLPYDRGLLEETVGTAMGWQKGLTEGAYRGDLPIMRQRDLPAIIDKPGFTRQPADQKEIEQRAVDLVRGGGGGIGRPPPPPPQLPPPPGGPLVPFEGDDIVEAGFGALGKAAIKGLGKGIGAVGRFIGDPGISAGIRRAMTPNKRMRDAIERAKELRRNIPTVTGVKISNVPFANVRIPLAGRLSKWMPENSMMRSVFEKVGTKQPTSREIEGFQTMWNYINNGTETGLQAKDPLTNEPLQQIMQRSIREAEFEDEDHFLAVMKQVFERMEEMGLVQSDILKEIKRTVPPRIVDVAKRDLGPQRPGEFSDSYNMEMRKIGKDTGDKMDKSRQLLSKNFGDILEDVLKKRGEVVSEDRILRVRDILTGHLPKTITLIADEIYRNSAKHPFLYGDTINGQYDMLNLQMNLYRMWDKENPSIPGSYTLRILQDIFGADVIDPLVRAKIKAQKTLLKGYVGNWDMVPKNLRESFQTMIDYFEKAEKGSKAYKTKKYALDPMEKAYIDIYRYDGWDYLVDIFGIFKTLASVPDNSIPGIQGWPMWATDPKTAWAATKLSWHAWLPGGGAKVDTTLDAIESHSLYNLFKRNGLVIPARATGKDIELAPLMNTFIGRTFRHLWPTAAQAENAAIGFAASSRFNHVLKEYLYLKDLKEKWYGKNNIDKAIVTDEEIKEIIGRAHILTGYGNLGPIDNMGRDPGPSKALHSLTNMGVFSIRKVASDLEFIPMMVRRAIQRHKFEPKDSKAHAEMTRAIAQGTAATLALFLYRGLQFMMWASLLEGGRRGLGLGKGEDEEMDWGEKNVKVIWDPWDANFGNVRIGNTYYDHWWGGQTRVAGKLMQLLYGRKTSSTTGEQVPADFMDIFARWGTGKQSPLMQLIVNYIFTKEDFMGNRMIWDEDINKSLFLEADQAGEDQSISPVGLDKSSLLYRTFMNMLGDELIEIWDTNFAQPMQDMMIREAAGVDDTTAIPKNIWEFAKAYPDKTAMSVIAAITATHGKSRTYTTREQKLEEMFESPVKDIPPLPKGQALAEMERIETKTTGLVPTSETHKIRGKRDAALNLILDLNAKGPDGVTKTIREWHELYSNEYPNFDDEQLSKQIPYSIKRPVMSEFFDINKEYSTEMSVEMERGGWLTQKTKDFREERMDDKARVLSQFRESMATATDMNSYARKEWKFITQLQNDPNYSREEKKEIINWIYAGSYAYDIPEEIFPFLPEPTLDKIIRTRNITKQIFERRVDNVE